MREELLHNKRIGNDIIDLDSGAPIEDWQYDIDSFQTGYFFKSKELNGYYLISIEKTRHNGNCKAIIYTLPYSATHANGTKVGTFDASCEAFATIDIWGKYFFPTFPLKMQCYHQTSFDNEFNSLAEVMNYALALGLKISGITPY